MNVYISIGPTLTANQATKELTPFTCHQLPTVMYIIGNKLIWVGSATLVAEGMLGFCFRAFLCEFDETGAAAGMRRGRRNTQGVDFRFVP